METADAVFFSVKEAELGGGKWYMGSGGEVAPGGEMEPGTFSLFGECLSPTKTLASACPQPKLWSVPVPNQNSGQSLSPTKNFSVISVQILQFRVYLESWMGYICITYIMGELNDWHGWWAYAQQLQQQT